MADATIQDTVTVPAGAGDSSAAASAVSSQQTLSGPAAGAADAAASTPDVRSEINSLAQQFGFSGDTFQGFPTVESARAAIRLAVEASASEALKPVDYFSAAKVAQPAAPVQPAQPYQPIDLASLGLDKDDGAAKAIVLLEAKLAAESQKNQAAIEQWQQQQVQQLQQQRLQEAASVVDTFASTRYGTSTHRTPIQQHALNNLYSTAEMVYAKSGGTLSLNQCMQRARMLDENPQPVVMQTAKPAQTLNTSAAPTGVALKSVAMTDQWSQTPEVRAALGLPPIG